MNIKNRVKSLEMIPANELKPHPANWRVHSDQQRNTIRAAFAEIGIAGACLVIQDRGGYMLVDGHLRAEELSGSKQPVPCLVLDLTKAEAKKLLATYDTIGGLAEVDLEALQSLNNDVEWESEELNQAVLDLMLTTIDEMDQEEEENTEPGEKLCPHCNKPI